MLKGYKQKFAVLVEAVGWCCIWQRKSEKKEESRGKAGKQTGKEVWSQR